MREARIVELYDAGIVLAVKNAGDGFYEFPEMSGKHLVIEGKDINKLAEYFGIRTYGVIRQRGDRTVEAYLGSEDFTLRWDSIHVGDGYDIYGFVSSDRIVGLQASIVGPRLLSLVIHWEWDNEPEGGVGHHKSCLTYSGHFTVWWVDESGRADGQAIA